MDFGRSFTGMMTTPFYEKLDYWFPFLVFAYGSIITFALSHPTLIELAESRLPSDLVQRFRSHRLLALVCLFVGGLWSLQNLWLS